MRRGKHQKPFVYLFQDKRTHIEKPCISANVDFPEADTFMHALVMYPNNAIAGNMGNNCSSSQKYDIPYILIPCQQAKPCDTVLFFMLPPRTFFLNVFQTMWQISILNVSSLLSESPWFGIPEFLGWTSW